MHQLEKQALNLYITCMQDKQNHSHNINYENIQKLFKQKYLNILK